MSVQDIRISLSTGATRVLHTDGVGGDGPTIVLLHGYGDSAGSWSGVLAHLDRLGHRALAVDMPGFGRAEPRPPGPMIDVLDEGLRSLLDTLVDGPVFLVGNSLGCVPALRAAATLP